MKTSDIPDRPILEYLANQTRWAFTYKSYTGSTRPSVTRVVPTGTSYRTLVSKMRALIQRGLVSGCGCGCGGYFKITDKGRAYLNG